MAAVGKLMFAQMSELVNEFYNNVLPANLSGTGPNQSLDYGFKGAEVVMAAYIAALCQAVDLRYAEENFKFGVKKVVSQSLKKNADEPQFKSGFWEKKLIDSPLTQRLRGVLVEKEMSEKSCSFSSISEFEEEMKVELKREFEAVREALESGQAPLVNRIKLCKSYPIYEFVRSELMTGLLSGLRSVCPGEDFDKVFMAINEGKIIDPLLPCLEGWDGAPSNVY
ncbi:putative phenylalanine ammonia-lyase [Dioscorea sansibarensis]